MVSSQKRQGISLGKKILIYALVAIAIVPPFHARNASAAACVAPGTDYGQVTNLSTNIDTAGTYRIWTRMAAENSSNNTYLLEIDGNTCFTVGGSGVPVYSNGASTHFVNNTTNWRNTTNTGSVVSMNLSTGTHTIKLIGNAPGVVIDRLIFTTSTSCTPTGTGANCADTTAPTISAIASSSVTTTGANISWTTNDTSTTRVEYGLTTSYGSFTTLNSSLVTSHTATLSGLTAGTTYNYRVISTDEAGNTATSSNRTFTTVALPTYAGTDINQDGRVDILDVSMMISVWNQTGPGLGRNDINGDGVVNILDLSMLIANYGN